MQHDEDETPRSRRLELTPPTPSKHPRVMVAREWRGAIVSAVAMGMVGMLAAMQGWPYEVSLPALGIACGPAALDAWRSRR